VLILAEELRTKLLGTGVYGYGRGGPFFAFSTSALGRVQSLMLLKFSSGERLLCARKRNRLHFSQLVFTFVRYTQVFHFQQNYVAVLL